MDTPQHDPPTNPTHWPLVTALRIIALVDMLALISVAMPGSWIAMGHELCGLGALPDAPIVGYLARSASALYALHGLLVGYLSFHVERYSDLICLMARVAICYGMVVVGIDLAEGMPTWWTLVEGPWISLSGVAILLFRQLAAQPPTWPATLHGKCRGNLA